MFVLAKLVDRLGEDRIGTRFDAGDCALDSRVHALDREGIGARHNDKVIIGAGIDGRFHPVDHLCL